ncbi:MAG: hypothetical protein NXI08_16635, partial [bacterium]|nr:hypothetical protein [bacterium]
DTAFGAKQRQSQTPGSIPRSSLPAGVQAREMAPQASWPTQSNNGNRDNKRKRKRRNNTRQEVAKGEGSNWKPARTNKRHKLKQCRHASMHAGSAGMQAAQACRQCRHACSAGMQAVQAMQACMQAMQATQACMQVVQACMQCRHALRHACWKRMPEGQACR